MVLGTIQIRFYLIFMYAFDAFITMTLSYKVHQTVNILLQRAAMLSFGNHHLTQETWKMDIKQLFVYI